MLSLAKGVLRATVKPELQEKLLFLGRVGYWPNFSNPQTLNEKVNWRKLYSSNDLYVTCSDKIAVRDYVEARIGSQYLIPILFQGESISADELLNLGDNIVVKTNHDCGSVFMIRENSEEQAAQVSEQIAKSLKVDFGRRTNQWWYSKIPPRVYVEKLLEEDGGKPPLDFKFSLFRSDDPAAPEGFIKVDYDRGLPTRTRTFYTLDRQILPGMHRSESARPFPEIENFNEMLQAAITLAQGFDYVRVDLYSMAGKTYFGELTFSQSGGRSRFTREADEKLGNWWKLDMSRGGSERPNSTDD